MCFRQIALIIFLVPAIAIADEKKLTHSQSSGLSEEISSESMTVTGKNLAKLKQRATSLTKQTEILSSEQLRKFGSHSLADAISQGTGVNTQTFCANCGAKRITINGLRGEHTTILIDGFPLHSAVSAFYGIDAIPVSDIAYVEVNRGAGNALLAPESIGGSINIATLEPLQNKVQIYSEKGTHGSSLSSAVASAKNDVSAVVLSAQRSIFEAWDVDANGIGESPYRANEALSIKIVQKLSDRSKASFRRSESKLAIIGGNTKKFRPLSYTRIQAQPQDFIDNDVSKNYLGDLNRITDVVELSRNETALSLDHELNKDSSLNLKLSRVLQMQDAEYSHGYDYRNKDKIDFMAASAVHIQGDHALTMTFEQRKQRMISMSEALYIDRQRPLTPDSLSYDNQALGLMDQISINEDLSLDLAARIDQIQIEWFDLKNTIDETIFSPKINAKYAHDEHISSQLSLGRGFRPPLTLFESEHGSDHDGFLVEIDRIERSNSAVYSLSANYPSWFITGTAHHTQLINMAYAEDRVVKGMPMIFKNSNRAYGVSAFDLFAGITIADALEIQVSYEHFSYQNSYARKLPAAAIEQRLVFDGDFNFEPFNLGLQLVWTGQRNLSRYGYNEHYKKYDLEVSSSNFGKVSDQKRQQAPSFWHANVRSKWAVNKIYAMILRINNMFDYTQTGTGDSPTTWHYHVNHAHFDNFHTWGPLSGREYFAGIEGIW